MTRTLTATIWREDDGYVALCSELDIASQGDSVEEARKNLKEAVELFFETAHSDEVAQRLNTEIYVTPLEVTVGEAA
jgi:predicted RNase H-like HicB family nuclease